MQRDAGDPAEAKLGTLCLGRTHHPRSELAGMNLRGGFGRTQHLADRHLVR
jgi:hypothetical protein